MKRALIVIFLITASGKIGGQDTISVKQSEQIRLEDAIIEYSEWDTTLVNLLIDYANLCLYDLNFLDGN